MTLMHRVTRTAAAAGVFLATALAAPSAPLPNTLRLAPESEAGQRLIVEGHVVGEASKPVANARLHVYQTDASGRYTLERAMDEPHARLSGWIQTDGQGRFVLDTIRPGGYPKALRLGDRDRKIPAHIHVDVTASGYEARKVQVVFSDDPLLADAYWQDWVRRMDQPVVTVTTAGSTQTTRLILTLRRANAR